MKLKFLATLALGCVVLYSGLANAADVTNPRAVAVIIGNKDYVDRIPDVDFAHNDADAFKKFVVEVQGYDPENIIDLRDATQAQLQAAFGNRATHEGKLWRYLDPKGRSDVTVFYSGHGVPGLKDRKGYILPVNADPNAPEINGFPLDTLLGNLSKLKAKSISVFIDACFSGDTQKGMLVRATSGITISPKLPSRSSRMTVLSAAQGDQVASWDFKAKHGMFTKHLLDALYGEADKGEYGDGNKKVSLAEVRSYLDDHLTRAARREYGRHQNAWVTGGKETVLASVVLAPKRSSVESKTKPAAGVFAKSYKPGDTFKDCYDCPAMVVVHRKRTNTNGAGKENLLIAVGKYEITFDQWNACVKENGCNNYIPSDEGWGRGRRPVINISWSDTQNFLKWLSVKTKRSYRLPTIDEWERFTSFGPSKRGNEDARPNLESSKTYEVGVSGANQYGLFDTFGNAAEWTSDCALKQSPENRDILEIGSGCLARYIRGGSWKDVEWQLLLAKDYYNYILIRSPTTGFRVVADL